MVTRDRVLISSWFDPSSPGGGNQYSLDLARCWLKDGRRVHVLSSDHRRSLLDLEPYRSSGALVIHELCDANRLLLSHVDSPAVYDEAKRIIGAVDPDSVHVHNFHGLLSAVWAAVDSGVKTVYAALDFGLLCQSWYLFDGGLQPCAGPAPDKCRACLLRQNKVPWTKKILARMPGPVLRFFGKDPLYHRQFRSLTDYFKGAGERLDRMLPLLKRFSAVFTISPATGRVLASYGVPPERIHFQVQGFPSFPKAEEPSIPPAGTRLIFLGHMDPIKGFQVIVRALEGLPPGLPLKVCLYGREARRFVARQPAAARAYLEAAPSLVGAEVEREIAASDGSLLPSLWHENTPYALLRALAAGRPVLASDHLGMSHLIRHGENGWLVPPGDAVAWRTVLRRAAEDPGFLRGMRKNCRFTKTAEEYTAEVESVMAGVPA